MLCALQLPFDAEYTLERFVIVALIGAAVLCVGAVVLYRAIRKRASGWEHP
jgi:hypothetical protein